ncbi:vomeronasal type-1 receptor 4-like [Octodon degus]|uniref:Vomeronasal type-1 receptor n=1 Tax=Octodon degus TaxID=10160 RepID=A0A6P3F3C0_OCTDE|nr:vomeronasal type-1 receptor 4-like [Octodon degus]
MILNLGKGTILAFLTGLGTVGNTVVLESHTRMYRGSEKKAMHLILIHLAFTNIIMLLSKGIPRTIAAFGVRHFLDDTGCKVVCYLERVARGLSICTSSLLTVFQAFTVSPSHSRWRRLQPSSSRYILLLFPFLWIFSFLTNINLLLYITSASENTSQISTSDYYCYFQPESQKVRLMILGTMAFRDAVSQGVMCGASGYMVLLLHQHHQRVLQLRSSKVLCKTPAEVKAAQSVLLLMLCFLLFYWADCVFNLLLNFFLENNLILNFKEFLTLGYAILSPFVLIHRDGHVAECCSSQRERGTFRKYLLPACFP